MIYIWYGIAWQHSALIPSLFLDIGTSFAFLEHPHTYYSSTSPHSHTDTSVFIYLISIYYYNWEPADFFLITSYFRLLRKYMTQIEIVFMFHWTQRISESRENSQWRCLFRGFERYLINKNSKYWKFLDVSLAD